MRIWVATKTFDNETDMNSFVDKNVGDRYYNQIRPKYIDINGLEVMAIVRCISGQYKKIEMLKNNGFECEWMEV